MITGMRRYLDLFPVFSLNRTHIRKTCGVPHTPYLIAFDCPLWPRPLSPQPSANRLLQLTDELVATEWSAGSLV